MSELAIPVDGTLLVEIVLRSRGRMDVVTLVDSVLRDFLERTKGDADIWSDEHAEEAADVERQSWLQEYGDPIKGYHWHSLFLPNGSQLKAMPYGKPKVAEVKRQQVVFDEMAMSPSQFVSKAWNGTSRSAPRDLWIKRPGDHDWVWAKSLLK